MTSGGRFMAHKLGILAFFAVTALTSCSPGGDSTNSATGASGSGQSLISQIQSRGELRIGVDSGSKPLVFKDATSSEWHGYYYDLMSDWASVLKVKLTPVQTTYANMIASLQAGQIDVAVALNPRPLRSLSVVFTQPLTFEIDAFAIRPAATPGITSWSQLNNSQYTVCVQAGGAPDLTITALKPKAQVTRLPNQPACQEALLSGRATAYLTSAIDLASFAAANNGVRLIFPEQPINKSGTAFAIAQGHLFSDILALNVEIQDFIDSGKLAASEKANGLANPLDYTIGNVPGYASTLSS
jgi:polar amino acid transport system substrate-binding protein